MTADGQYYFPHIIFFIYQTFSRNLKILIISILMGFEPTTPTIPAQADIHYTTAADDFVLLALLYNVDCFISQK
jgi:hypothetical protein